MIERNDFGNFTEGRLGWKQFADEGYRNYTGGEDFYNLFGSRASKKTTIRESVRAKYADLSTDCSNIQTAIDVVSNDIATLLKQKTNLQQREALDESNKVLGEFKNRQIIQGCQQAMAQKEAESKRAETLETLTKLSDVSVGKAQQELAGLAPQEGGGNVLQKNKNLLIYGGLGLVGLVVIALILKRR